MLSTAYIHEPSSRTPEITISPGKISILGRSIPDDPSGLYGPLMDQLTVYMNEFDGRTDVRLGFEYINTSSTKWVFSILRKLSELRSQGKNFDVTWYYENGDDDMIELGQMLGSFLDYPFTLSEVSNIETAASN